MTTPTPPPPANGVPPVIAAVLRPDEKYHAAVRLSLDRSQLPKPFQIDAITDREWQVEAKTKRWTFQPPEPK